MKDKNNKLNLLPIRLKSLINALGITQSRFAELCGLTPAVVSQLLNGSRSPSIETLEKIHSATGVSLDHLLGIKVSKPFIAQARRIMADS